MEKLVEDKVFKKFQYYILGQEKQLLNVVLGPAQSIYVDDNKIVCCSDGLTKENVKKPFWGEPKEHTPSRSKYINTSEGLAYMTINGKGGRIVAFNSLLVKGMLFREDVVLAHTHNAALKIWK